MATLEQVEKLREKASVTFEEAKEALDASGGDLLDALIYLEKKGKVKPPASGGFYSSGASGGDEDEKKKANPDAQSKQTSGESFADMMKRFGRFVAKIINKGNNNYFEAEKNGDVIISCPITALVILLIFLFWIVVPLVILGLFFGFRYRFRGSDLGKESVNRVMDSASDAAEDFKKSFGEEHK